jgi:hypothetical protein
MKSRPSGEVGNCRVCKLSNHSQEITDAMDSHFGPVDTNTREIGIRPSPIPKLSSAILHDFE